MSYDSKQDHGMAGRRRYIHVSKTDFDAIVQGDNTEELEERNYAQLVYQVNTTSVSGGGTVVTPASDEYSRVVQPVGVDTYIGLASAGSDLSAAVWQAQKIDVDGSRQWADGNANFDNVASVLSGLTYTY